MITRIRAKKQLQDLFVVVYAPAEMSKEEQAEQRSTLCLLLLLLTIRLFLCSSGLLLFPNNAYL